MAGGVAKSACTRSDSTGRAEGTRWDSARTRIRSAAQALVKCLLFSGEAPLEAEIQGTSGFHEKYLAGGVKDARKRSLREFDLRKRLFRYPCSDLVRSEQFQKLPAEAREAVWLQIREVLHAEERPREFAHLSDDDCRAIQEILLATVPGVPPEIVEPPPVEEPAPKR